MLSLEQLLWALGYARVAGVDEVGLGPLAGPVVAAAVVFPRRAEALPVDDSKKLSAARREELDRAIREAAQEVSVGCVDVSEIDGRGIRAAGLEAMRRALVGLAQAPDYALVDARTIPGVDVPQSSYVRGDGFIHAVAAASIVAKVHRDALMKRLGERFPAYGFGRHMGYGTVAHLEALRQWGPCPEHRRSFAPVQRVLGRRG